MIKLAGSAFDFDNHPSQPDLCVFFVDMANQFGFRHSVFADGVIDSPYNLSVEGKRKNVNIN